MFCYCNPTLLPVTGFARRIDKEKRGGEEVKKGSYWLRASHLLVFTRRYHVSGGRKKKKGGRGGAFRNFPHALLPSSQVILVR